MFKVFLSLLVPEPADSPLSEILAPPPLFRDSQFFELLSQKAKLKIFVMLQDSKEKKQDFQKYIQHNDTLILSSQNIYIKALNKQHGIDTCNHYMTQGCII